MKLCREKALQLSLDKGYLEQVLQQLTEQKRAKKPKGFFNIRFMSDEEYAREQVIPDAPAEMTFELNTPQNPTLNSTSTPIQELPDEIALDPFEEEKIDETKPAPHKSAPPKLELEEETIEAKEVDSKEVQYEFQENTQPEEIIMEEAGKQPEVVIEEHVGSEKKDAKKHKKTPAKTKEASETEDFINQLAKDSQNPLFTTIIDPANSNNDLSSLLNQSEKHVGKIL